MPAYQSVPYDNLIAGMVQPIVTQSIVINQAAGAKYDRGTVLARTGFEVDGTWICTIVNSAATAAEAKVPVGVLADVEVDATLTKQRATAYTSGEFNREALKFGGTDSIAIHEAALNNAKIYTKRVVK
ncbi:head decoration protein [Paenibacillus agilis]|uniref:Head decoration protein n=1 Tax=Paenibacillus agilis TaxID=3020863 RepID=A0A559IZJ2_9BACL|nr:head decoration protein [Paenibacillus agilis]TVX93040.1 head decoration protein [Paenibacillus agilis]